MIASNGILKFGSNDVDRVYKGNILIWQKNENEHEQVNNIGNITEAGWTWFGRPTYAYSPSNNKYWIGVLNGQRAGVIEYNGDSDTFNFTQVGTVNNKDDHNQTKLLIRASDGRLIAFYGEHTGPAIRYKISTNPFDSSSWGSEYTLDPSNGYAYTSPYQASNGDIYIFFRHFLGGSTFYWAYMKSTDDGLTFSYYTSFLQNPQRPYLISVQHGDIIHFAGTNGHPQTNNSINVNQYHFYFDMITTTFHKSNGDIIAIPMVSSNQTLVQGFTGNDTSWGLDITIKENKPRIIYCKYPSGRNTLWKVKEIWFVEWDGSNWVNNQMITQTLDGYVETDTRIQEYAYEGGSRFSIENPDIIWMSKQINSVLEIHKVDISINPFYIEQITFNSQFDNWRPISVISEKNNLIWLVKNRYAMFTDFNQSISCFTV
jgi:hypothetical protein